MRIYRSILKSRILYPHIKLTPLNNPSKRFLFDNLSGKITGKKKYKRDEIFKILDLDSFSDEEMLRSYHRLISASSISSSNSLSNDPIHHENRLKSVDLHGSEDTLTNHYEENTTTHHEKVFDIKLGLEKLIIESNRKVDKNMIEYLADDLSKPLKPHADQNKLSPSSSAAAAAAVAPSSLTSSTLPGIPTISLSYEDYRRNSRTMAEQLDLRLWPIATSFLWTGTSIGIIIPCMPILVHMLNIPAAEYGFIVGAFGLSKLLGNIPAGYYIDKYGRKPAMVMGLGFCAIGVGGIGLSLFPGFGTPWLFFCRLMTGLGVSAFTGGSFMYINDISTALNRTRTFAPAMAAFQAGTALGPAIGGILVHNVGMGPTYAIVGASFTFLTLMNHILLPETLDKTFNKLPLDTGKELNDISTKKSSVYAILSHTLHSWYELLQNHRIRDIVLLNSAYWIAIAGAQMTLLPLFMVSPILNLNASEIGGSFAMMSIVGVLSSYRVASLADKIGKIQIILLGSVFVSFSVMAIPYATSFPMLLSILAPLAIGSTAISSVPQAHISDLTHSHQRSNAMALLRAGGDFGLIVGASLTGIFADFTSIAASIEVNGLVMFAAMTLFGIRSRELMTMKSKKKSNQIKDDKEHNA